MSEKLANGEIWRIHNTEKIGTDFALIIENETFIERFDSVVIIPVTKAVYAHPSPSVAILTPLLTGLDEPLAAICHKITFNSKKEFIAREGALSSDAMALVKRILSMLLGLLSPSEKQ